MLDSCDILARLDSCDTLPNPNRDAGAAGSGVSRDTRLAEARLARRNARLLARDPLREPFSDVRSLPRDALSAAGTSPPCLSISLTSPFCVKDSAHVRCVFSNASNHRFE